MALPQQLRQQTSNCSLLFIYRPRKDERLSWPSWLTYSGWFTHLSGHPSAAGRAQDSKSTPAKDRRSIPLDHATMGSLHHTYSIYEKWSKIDTSKLARWLFNVFHPTDRNANQKFKKALNFGKHLSPKKCVLLSVGMPNFMSHTDVWWLSR